jgi:predicted ATPase
VRELPSGIVTFLFTDIEGSTRLLHELGDGYAAALSEHRRHLREAFSRHGGVEVDTQGDAFFVVFASAKEAVLAARQGQEALASGPIRVRMGLHTGQAQLSEEGYVGLEVHKGARIAASGHGGQVLLSQATRKLVKGDLRDLGEHRVKDFNEPVWIFQLGDERFPPLKTISNTNLPRPVSSFVGRERELGEVVALLQNGGRLVTLSGPGGSGKTRLAIEAATELVPEHRNGVFWVALAALRDPRLVTDTIAQTIGAKENLIAHIGEREMLLVLDNFEQVVEAAPELSGLLLGCPNLTMLVTSRELLRVQGEFEYAVPPLADADAVGLFCARAQLDRSEEIIELCRRLDNLPLAVELAAARTKVLSPAQILKRLSQRLDLFKGGRDAEARQQTLRATIEWSYDLLTEAEQRLLAQLAVFAGGCTLEAAEEVAGADLDTLQSLVEKSLLRYTHERFWMLETIREYAAERLEQTDDFEARRRHARFYSLLGESLREEFSDGHPEATARMAAEDANFQASLSWAAEAGEPQLVFSFVWSLWRFWLDRGRVREGERWARWVIEAGDRLPPQERVWGLFGAGELARFVGDLETAVRVKYETLAIFSALSETRWVAANLADLADIISGQGDITKARALADEALAVRRTLGAPFGVAHALVTRALIEFRGGEYGAARRLFEESLQLWRTAGSVSDEAGTELMLGECDRRLGDLRAARKRLRCALQHLLALERRSLIPEALQEIAAAYLIEQPTRAASLLGASERLLAEMGLPRWDRRDYETSLSRLRDLLGEDGFDTAWQAGLAMPDDETLAHALSMD